MICFVKKGKNAAVILKKFFINETLSLLRRTRQRQFKIMIQELT